MNNSDYQLPSNNSFAAENNDLDSTRDDFEEERKELERQQAEQNRTNLFKTRVIESEINSSLVFQIALYYNWFYCFLCFVLQLSSIAYKLYIFTNDNFTIARIVLVLVWFIVENIRLNMGYRANIQEIVNCFLYKI